MKNNWDKSMEDLWINSTIEKQIEIINLSNKLSDEDSLVMMQSKNEILSLEELEIRLRNLIEKQKIVEANLNIEELNLMQKNKEKS